MLELRLKALIACEEPDNPLLPKPHCKHARLEVVALTGKLLEPLRLRSRKLVPCGVNTHTIFKVQNVGAGSPRPDNIVGKRTYRV